MSRAAAAAPVTPVTIWSPYVASRVVANVLPTSKLTDGCAVATASATTNSPAVVTV